VWSQLDETERLMPEVAIEASSRMLKVGGDIELARNWLLPVWDHMLAQPGALTDAQRISLIRALESSFAMASGAPEAPWLTRIEQAQLADPADSNLQYLAGMTCMRLQLWGKAQQLLQHALPKLQDAGLARNAWAALAELADQRGDVVAATQAWKNAAKVAASA
jgi:HemY protein